MTSWNSPSFFSPLFSLLPLFFSSSFLESSTSPQKAPLRRGFSSEGSELAAMGAAESQRLVSVGVRLLRAAVSQALVFGPAPLAPLSRLPEPPGIVGDNEERPRRLQQGVSAVGPPIATAKDCLIRIIPLRAEAHGPSAWALVTHLMSRDSTLFWKRQASGDGFW